ncbi:hypothetical protein P9B03_08605 [Metasolibacillus meyeri]|uniref:Phage protein n=1 Tax=Metasolibacillus meyeri TaxID=1071052 RepID=A0AAW9NTA5_9BACL|nr:hypothetical protein [Metasolibacillus meyeri]MEC1178539.1 hypothetical protein [Metasolibacillus meyeri]
MTITVNAVRNAVIAKLNTFFPSPAYRKYGEEIAQGFQAPCFFIKLFPVQQTQIMGRRYSRQHTFNVHYFPSTDYSNEEMHSIAEQLYEVLEYITPAAMPVRGTKMKQEIHDSVLHFWVEYSFDVYKPIEETKMQKLEGVDFDNTRDNKIENNETDN